MSFDRIRLPGLWLDGSTVPGSQWEQFDENQSNAIDGLNAGAYAFQDNLILGGAPGVFIEFDCEFVASAPVSFTDTLSVFGDSLLTGANVDLASPSVSIGETTADLLLVNSFMDVLGGVHFEDASQFDGVATFQDVADFNGNATFNGEADFNDRVAFNGLVFFSDDVSFHDAQFNGTVTIAAPMAFTASGRVPQRQILGADAGGTYRVTSGDHVIVQPATLTAPRGYIISNTGAVDGDRMRFTNLSTAHELTIFDPSVAPLTIIKNAAGYAKSVDIERVAGSWVVLGMGKL